MRFLWKTRLMADRVLPSRARLLEIIHLFRSDLSMSGLAMAELVVVAAAFAEKDRLVDRDTIDYEAAVVEFTRWSRPARLGRRLEQERNRVGAVRVVQAAIGGSDEK